MHTPKHRAVAVVRVSQVGSRNGEAFASPETQRASIEAACEREGLRLTKIHDELDISGGRSLDQRPGLREAVAAIEAGDADVIAAAYFDRLFRSLQTQAEVLDRVERAGGRVLAVDVGEVSSASAGQWLSATMLGAVAEYHRRTTKERSAEAQARAVARGVAPHHVTPGYVRGEDGRYRPGPLAPVVREAFDKRANGAPIRDVRSFLNENGVVLSYSNVARLLKSRVVLGEIHFGQLANVEAHEPIVDRDVWQRVQRSHVPRGRVGKSTQLLARLGVLRCGSCGARMCVGMNKSGPTYRCPPTGDCEQPLVISAPIVERVVADSVNEAVHGTYGIWDKASANRRQAQADLERAQSELDSAIRVLADFSDEESARERLAELRQARDDAQERVDRIGGPRRVKLTITSDWDRLSLEQKRDLIKALVERVDVLPGRGEDRIKVELIES